MGVWSEFRSCKHRLASGSDQISEMWVAKHHLPACSQLAQGRSLSRLPLRATSSNNFCSVVLEIPFWHRKVVLILKCRKLSVVPDLKSPELSDLSIFFERQFSPSPSLGIVGTPKVTEATRKELG